MKNRTNLYHYNFQRCDYQRKYFYGNQLMKSYLIHAETRLINFSAIN